MAYIPPHKRNSKEPERPLPTPELLAPKFKKNLSMRSSKSHAHWTGRISYANDYIRRWCIVGLDNENQFPSSVNLEQISLETGGNRLALFNTSLDNDSEGSDARWNFPKSSWVSIAENVLEDLLSSFNQMRNEEVKPMLFASVGKVLFHRIPSINLESIRENLDIEVLKQLNGSFYKHVPVSYKEKIVKETVSKIGFDFEQEEETYQIKIELNQLRNMVMDISCPTKDLDLRLLLRTKRIVTNLSDDEMQSIRDLINCAVIDPNVKGGLRWPLGKEYSGDKYKVCGVWHVIANKYKHPSLRLTVRYADRFDFTTSTGEATCDMHIMLKEVVSKLQEEKVEVNSVSEILVENMKLIWENFLCCERFLT